jgi:hypothetical protein
LKDTTMEWLRGTPARPGGKIGSVVIR